MATVFDFVKSVSETKEDIYEGNEKEYSPFVVNKALSFNVDCVFVTQELNKYPDIPKEVQYHFLLNSLDKKKRWGKWVKKDSLPDDLKLVKEAFGYSDQKAMTALSLLNDKQLLELKSMLDKGGKK